MCEREAQKEDSGEVGTDSEIEEGRRLECKERERKKKKRRIKTENSSSGIETPGCMIT